VSSEALAKEDPLRRGVAEDLRGATAGKSWDSTTGRGPGIVSAAGAFTVGLVLYSVYD